MSGPPDEHEPRRWNCADLRKLVHDFSLDLERLPMSRYVSWLHREAGRVRLADPEHVVGRGSSIEHLDRAVPKLIMHKPSRSLDIK